MDRGAWRATVHGIMKSYQTLEREISDDLKFKPHTIHFEVKQRMSVTTPLFSNL